MDELIPEGHIVWTVIKEKFRYTYGSQNTQDIYNRCNEALPRLEFWNR
jgi:hypothetical protein